MARFRVFQEIKNNVWELTFVNDPLYLSEQDKMLMQKFGEPEVDSGGVFLEDTANEYTLPTKYVRLRSDFPLTVKFDSKQTPFDTNTEVKVLAYRDDMISRITDALATLRANTEADTSFSGEEVYNL